MIKIPTFTYEENESSGLCPIEKNTALFINSTLYRVEAVYFESTSAWTDEYQFNILDSIAVRDQQNDHKLFFGFDKPLIQIPKEKYHFTQNNTYCPEDNYSKVDQFIAKLYRYFPKNTTITDLKLGTKIHISRTGASGVSDIATLTIVNVAPPPYLKRPTLDLCSSDNNVWNIEMTSKRIPDPRYLMLYGDNDLDGAIDTLINYLMNFITNNYQITEIE